MISHNNTTTLPPTTNPDVNDDVHYYLFITKIVCYCVISVVGSLANVVICVGLSRERLKSSEYFILNLAIADLLVCAIGIPLDIYLEYADSWPYGPYLCHVIYPSQTCLILISILTLMGMSLERHRAICSPLKQRLKPKWLRSSIACIWLIAIAAVVPYAKILKYRENDCLENWSVPDNGKYYTLALFIIDYCIPLTIITYCYIRAGYVLHKKFNKFNKESTSSMQSMATMKRLQQKKKVIKIFSFAVIIFVICVLPGDCYWMWFSFRTIKSHPLDIHLQAFSTITLYANSAINPFIFGAVQMICHRNMRSRISDQLTSTTGFSGSVSSAGVGEGFSRKLFSRTAVRRLMKYRSLKAKNEAQNSNSETKGLNYAKRLDGETIMKYRNVDRGSCSTDDRDTHKRLRDTSFNTPVMRQKICDSEQKINDTEQEIRDKDQGILVTDHDTKKGRIDTNGEMRDTEKPQLDTNEEIKYEICTSNDTLHDARSISSDSSATLHREDDTFSLTSETIHNTNCVLIERTGSSDCQCYNTNEHTEDERLHEIPRETNKLDQNRLESSKFVEHNLGESSNSTRQDDTDAKMTIKDVKLQKPYTCEKNINSDFSESTASGLNKIANNLSEFFQSGSVKESDV